jgi:prolyl-tRNA synthetase
MTHGDDQGLVLPPNLAPFQVVIVPIYRNDDEKSLVYGVIERIKREMNVAGIRFKVDEREEVTPGFKFNDWEMRGVPLRIEVGPKDVAKNTVAFARRDIPGKTGKTFVPQDGLSQNVNDTLKTIQANLLNKATRFRDNNIHEAVEFENLQRIVLDGWAYSWWCGEIECETNIKAQTKATNRCIPLVQPGGEGSCISCGNPAREKAYFARAY